MEDDNASSCSYRHAMRSCSTVRFSSPTRISSSSSSSSVSGSSSRNEDYDGVYENDGDQELVRLCQGSVESRGLLASEEAQESGRPGAADHLVVMVNGIVGSAKDWKFAADQIQAKLGDKIIVHCSSCNSALTTFNGIDFMGKRLADEVQEVIGRTSGLKKISFIAHSLGGLVARYAIARLYVPAKKQHIKSTSKKFQSPETKSVCLSAGLEPINFITLATPHLGSRGHEQLPFLFGLRCLEKLAISIAHWFVGRTGKHLFLADEDQGQLPLLQRMATDCEEGMFMSALRAFKRRVAYANVVNDHMVGWRTSSLRRESQLPKVKLSPVDAKYPHIMYVDKMQPLVNESKRSCQKTQVRELDNLSAQDPLEEELVTKLTEVPWERVDVTFHGANQRFIAHSTIQELKARKRLHHLRHEYIVPSREKQRVDEKTDHPTLTSSQAIYSSTSGFSSRRAQQAHFMYGLHVPKQQDNQHMDLPKARGAVSIKTFHANQVLPRSKRSFCLRDFTLLREIFVLAENYAQMHGTEVRLTDVLRAYDIVLQRHGKDPTEDTFYYRMLLKLSLRSENDWWNRLNQEIANSNALFKGNSFRDRKILLCYWLQWRCYQKKGLNQAEFQSSLRYFYHTGDSSLQDEEAKNRFHLSQAEGLGCNQTLEFSALQALNSENGQGVVQPILQLSVKTTRSFSGKLGDQEIHESLETKHFFNAGTF